MVTQLCVWHVKMDIQRLPGHYSTMGQHLTTKTRYVLLLVQFGH